MSNPWENPAQKKTIPKYNLTLQQNALAFGMLHEKDDATTNFKKEVEGGRTHQNENLGDNDFELLVKKFRSDPKYCLAFARENLLSISKDTRLKPIDRELGIRRYVDAYFDLIIKLDRAAFPPTNEIRRGVPEYIPDGLVDMGSETKIEHAARSREKIIVDKGKIFSQSKEFFRDIFSQDLSKLESEKLKKYLAQKVAQFVFDKIPYDSKDKIKIGTDKSLRLSSAFDQKLGKCRHHALYAQVLMQALGISSRILKCDADFAKGKGFSHHAANLVRVDSQWYLMDVTGPEAMELQSDDKSRGEKIFTKRAFFNYVPESNIDTNKKVYNWSFYRNDYNDSLKRIDRKVVKYKSRNNMHYYIEDVDKI